MYGWFLGLGSSNDRGGRTSGTEGTVRFKVNGWAVPSLVSVGPTESRTSRFGSLITMRCAGDNAASVVVT